MTQLTFAEFEALAEAVQEAPIVVQLTVLEQPRWTLRYAVTNSLRLQNGYEGGGNIAEVITLSDRLTCYSQSTPVFAKGQVASEDAVFVAPPRSACCLACRPSHERRTIFLPTTLLYPSTQELERVSSAKPHILKPPSQLTGRFNSLRLPSESGSGISGGSRDRIVNGSAKVFRKRGENPFRVRNPYD